MDSKSISREGVGVRLPSLALGAPGDSQGEPYARELRAVAREVAGAVWGRLFIGLRSARLELEELMEAARRDRLALLRDERALSRQEELRAEVGRAGWCLGVLAAVEGHDLLGARRERDGLRWLIGLVAEARGLVLAPHAVELPASDGPVGSAVAVLAAWCALHASRRTDGTLRWRAHREPGLQMLAFAREGAALRAQLASRCACLDPGEDGSPRPVIGEDEILLVWS